MVVWVAVKAREDVGRVEWGLVGCVGNGQRVVGEMDADDSVGLVVPNGVLRKFFLYLIALHAVGHDACEGVVELSKFGAVGWCCGLSLRVARQGLHDEPWQRVDN